MFNSLKKCIIPIIPKWIEEIEIKYIEIVVLLDMAIRYVFCTEVLVTNVDSIFLNRLMLEKYANQLLEQQFQQYRRSYFLREPLRI